MVELLQASPLHGSIRPAPFVAIFFHDVFSTTSAARSRTPGPATATRCAATGGWRWHWGLYKRPRAPQWPAFFAPHPEDPGTWRHLGRSNIRGLRARPLMSKTWLDVGIYTGKPYQQRILTRWIQSKHPNLHASPSDIPSHETAIFAGWIPNFHAWWAGKVPN